VANMVGRQPPARVSDNVDGDFGFARWMKYPTSAWSLARIIDEAYQRRSTHAHVVANRRALRSRNAS